MAKTKDMDMSSESALNRISREYPKVCVNLQTDVR